MCLKQIPSFGMGVILPYFVSGFIRVTEKINIHESFDILSFYFFICPSFIILLFQNYDMIGALLRSLGKVSLVFIVTEGLIWFHGGCGGLLVGAYSLGFFLSLYLLLSVCLL
jgi:hypothetical protein